MKLTSKQINSFRQHVYTYYRTHGRRLPWRKRTVTPYGIFVSEVMLQQTQVDRVAAKFKEFTARFRNFRELAQAPLSAVLHAWQGLGYYRRAKFLHLSAKHIVTEFGGRLPRTRELLTTLPGVGAASAASIAAFAYNRPTIFIETNIRSVFLHHFFPQQGAVSDAAIEPLVAATLDTANPRRWYSALMDYGGYLKKLHGNPSRRSKHHTAQSPFAGSKRQVRGAIIRLLTEHATLRERQLIARIGRRSKFTQQVIKDLTKEGLVCKKGGKLSIAE